VGDGGIITDVVYSIVNVSLWSLVCHVDVFRDIMAENFVVLRGKDS
jgi:hypothetical protein